MHLFLRHTWPRLNCCHLDKQLHIGIIIARSPLMGVLETDEPGNTWCDYAAKYDYTIGLRRRDWAWEFLRRNSRFAEIAYTGEQKFQASDSCIPNSKVLHLYERNRQAEEWGLVFYPNPDQASPLADVYWLPEIDPAIVSVLVTPRQPHERDEMKAAIESCQIDVFRDPTGTEHLLTRGAFSTAQSICSGLSLLHARQPVKVNLDMRGPGRMERALAAYKQAEEILHPGPWRWTERTKRLRNALICLDVKDAGLTLRHAAMIIHSEARVEEDWSRQRAFRDRMRSYHRTGERLRAGGYRQLLNGKPLEAMC